ncbi:basic helix-loop-helix (bHLH) DNA-binding superfamily protein [Euphorbia peplus]|nr:basic helix-loop-helix (bHLH) DNA-binding superfamily protein [Euphorbia peplus]
MEITSAIWLSELGMEDPVFNYYPYEVSALDYPIEDLDFESISSEDDPVNFNSTQTFQNTNACPPMIQTSQITNTLEIRPKKQQKTSSWNSCTTDPITSQANSPSNSHIISFEKSPKPYGLNSTIKPKIETESNSLFGDTKMFNEQFGAAYYGQGNNKKQGGASSRSPFHAQDHVLAERKRRERLGQGFVSLSSVLPGLKKTDKASVLAEAIKYLKQMQDRVKTLEEQAAKRTMESVVYVKKSQVYADDELSSSDENSDGSCDQPLPEIEARVSDKDVLIRIHCENQKGCVQKLLSQVEKLPLNVINTSVLPFGNSTLDVTIVAQVEGVCTMTVKDIVRNIRQGLLN